MATSGLDDGEVARALLAGVQGHRHDPTSATYVVDEVAALTTRHHADRDDASDTGKLVVGVETGHGSWREDDVVGPRVARDGKDHGKSIIVEGVGLGADTSVAGRGTPIVVTPPPWRSGKRAVDAELDPDCGAVPIDVRSGLRDDSRTGAGTPGTGIGEDGDPAPTLGVGSATPAVATFAKRHRASTNTDDESWAEGDIAPTLNVNDVGDTRATVTIVEAAGLTSRGDGDAWLSDDYAPALNSGGGGQAGQGYAAAVVHEASQLEPETGQGADLRARPTDLSPAVTVTDHAKQTDRGVRVTTDAAVRRLTPTECARLQGFPDGWLLGLGLSDSAMYRMLGNAVCVSVSGFIGWRLAAWLRGWRP